MSWPTGSSAPAEAALFSDNSGTRSFITINASNNDVVETHPLHGQSTNSGDLATPIANNENSAQLDRLDTARMIVKHGVYHFMAEFRVEYRHEIVLLYQQEKKKLGSYLELSLHAFCINSMYFVRFHYLTKDICARLYNCLYYVKSLDLGEKVMSSQRVLWAPDYDMETLESAMEFKNELSELEL
ncbi:hypothetical protein QYF36_005927 [Acer negundo]|nr:hypothetical protein QYF36_005927 [Acer negundo]